MTTEIEQYDCTKPEPVVGNVYTLRQVLTQLKLPDLPVLNFNLLGDMLVTRRQMNYSRSQIDHMLGLKGFASTLWKYQGETTDWFPTFVYADQLSMFQFIEPAALSKTENLSLHKPRGLI